MNKRKGIIFAKGPYPLGGPSRRVRNLNRGFIKNKIESKIVITHPAPTYENYKNSENFVHFCLKPTNKKNNIFILHLKKFIGYYRGYLYLKKNKDINFVLLFGLGFTEGFFVKVFCKKNSVKFFAEYTDEINKKYWEDKLTIYEHFAKYNFIFFDKYILKKVDVLFVVSSYLAKKFSNMNLKIVNSIPSLIDFDDYIAMKSNNIFEIKDDNIDVFKSSSKKVVYAGDCSFTNGLLFFLECAKTVIKKHKINFEIIIIISRGDKRKIINYSDKLSIKENVTFISSILPKYIPAIYERSDILLLPEKGEIVGNAGFPGKIAEYLASGKPIISTIFSDLTDYLKHNYNAMLSDIGDHKTYTENLKKLLLNKELREHLGKNGIKTAKKYFEYKKGVLPFIKEM
ncbi:MAG: glycosyltransferase [Candidatus Cloacimonetes bacterium]|nr:glycosyltransferase [Candidatus Cloacimonadota bacterium]